MHRVTGQLAAVRAKRVHKPTGRREDQFVLVVAEKVSHQRGAGAVSAVSELIRELDGETGYLSTVTSGHIPHVVLRLQRTAVLADATVVVGRLHPYREGVLVPVVLTAAGDLGVRWREPVSLVAVWIDEVGPARRRHSGYRRHDSGDLRAAERRQRSVDGCRLARAGEGRRPVALVRLHAIRYLDAVGEAAGTRRRNATADRV